jgi:hypothetical protein
MGLATKGDTWKGGQKIKPPSSLAGGFWAGKEVLGVHGDNAVVRMSNLINLLRIYGGRITGRRARVWHGGPMEVF